MDYEDYLNESFLNESDSNKEDEKDEEIKNLKSPTKTTEDEILQSLWKKTDKETAAKLKRKIAKPRLKLTENELTSKKGLVALKEMFDNFKINNKLNLYENMSQILTKIEFWAHQLYPHYNLEDFLTRTELLSHKRFIKETIKQFRLGTFVTDSDKLITNFEDDLNKVETHKTAEELFDENFNNDVDYNELFANSKDLTDNNLTKVNQSSNNDLNADENLKKTKVLQDKDLTDFLSINLENNFYTTKKEICVTQNTQKINENSNLIENSPKTESINNFIALNDNNNDENISDVELTPIKKQKKIVFSDDESDY